MYNLIELTGLKNFPISFLAICLGLIGFTLAWQKAEHILNLPFSISIYLLYSTIILFSIIAITYVIKIIKYPNEVRKEFNHPIKVNFYPILAKLLLISSLVYLAINNTISKYLWWVGVVVQLVFTVIIMSMWIRQDKFKIQHINPSWFIPVVGLIIIPIAGVKHFYADFSWFCFSIGFFWWLILTVIVFNRIIFHTPISEKLLPTLAILFAPPIIGFISLTKLLGGLNYFGNMLYYFGLFLFILILFQAKMFAKLKFSLPWWAYSFPLDALAIGTLLMFESTKSVFYYYFSYAIFGFLNIIIAVLIVKTIFAIKRKQICIEED